MRQSDYYKKKNFANPNIFQSSSNNATNERSMPAPKPAPSRPEPTPPPSTPTITTTKEDKKEHEEIGADHLMKHPLQYPWTLWYKEADSSKSWEKCQNLITTFDTVEDFWSLYNHIKPPSEIKTGTDYSLFKEGIRPMWEDPVNQHGGCWSIVSSKPNAKIEMDEVWLDVILCLIGEAFVHSDEICGAVINNRKFNKIAIWTSDASNDEAVLEIGRKLKEALGRGNIVLHYTKHTDTMAKSGSVARYIHAL